ncbi:MAG: hypothetical protein LBU65_09575 [Planctomycetaceae bacterium]|jgi:type II secretion system protein D|nr:hypothetical protein [Planctomycetaceae bacterium]
MKRLFATTLSVLVLGQSAGFAQVPVNPQQRTYQPVQQQYQQPYQQQVQQQYAQPYQSPVTYMRTNGFEPIQPQELPLASPFAAATPTSAPLTVPLPNPSTARFVPVQPFVQQQQSQQLQQPPLPHQLQQQYAQQQYTQQPQFTQPQVTQTQYTQPNTTTVQRPAQRLTGQANYRLRNLSSTEFEKKLYETFSKRFVPLEKVQEQQHGNNLGRYRLPAKDGSTLDLTIDRQNRNVSLAGSSKSVAAALQILQLLDSKNGNTAGTNPDTEITTYNHGVYKAVVQTVGLLETELAQTSPRGNGGNAIEWRRDTPRPLVSQQLPLPQDEQNPNTNPQGGNNAGNQVNGGANGLGNDGTINPNAMQAIAGMQGAGLLGPVQIQVLDELGTIIVRGNKKDVAIVIDMIRQIEAVSMESEPNISVFRMKQADSTRVAEIVRSLYNQIYLARRGTVSITALAKPNVILLIGQNESVETASMLIEKLDMDVPPNDQFVVVRLRNSASDTMKTQLDTFYTRTSTLDSRVLITSHPRTNTLILQGSPRDLAEVTTLIRKLDTPGGDAVSNVKVIPLKNALASELATTLQSAITGSTTGGVAQNANSQDTRNPVLELQRVDPTEGTAIRSGVLADVSVTADSRSNSLIVKAPPETMPLVETLIMQLDKLPIAEAQIKVFEIVNADASALTTTLQTLFGTTTTGGGTGQTAGTNTLATTRPGISADDSTLVGLRFASEVRSNCIIAVGSPSDLDLVDALLLRLDDENMHNRQIVVYHLLNTAAADVQTAISNYITQELQAENQTVGTFEPMSPLEQYRKNVVVIAEPVTNKLIVSTTPRYYERIREIIRELDERPPMVFIKVCIAEVDLTNGSDFGMELGLQDAILFDRSTMMGGTAATAGTFLPGFNFVKNALGTDYTTTDNSLVGSQGITNLGLNRTNSTNGAGGFVFSASSESVSVLIRALETKGKVQILSSPNITTLDNKNAQLVVGQTVRFVTGTNVNNNTISNETTPEEVGVILDVTPRITPDNLVVMNIYTERSKLGADADGTVIGIQEGVAIRVPPVDKTMLQTTVSVMSGQTTVLGGLIHEEKTMSEVGVPLLNRIPILKHAFSYTSKTSRRKELVIIMTPTVIRNEFELEMIKQQELSRMNWCVSDVTRLGGQKVGSRIDGCYAGETQVFQMLAPSTPMKDDQLPNEKIIAPQLPNKAVPQMPTLAPERE